MNLIKTHNHSHHQVHKCSSDTRCDDCAHNAHHTHAENWSKKKNRIPNKIEKRNDCVKLPFAIVALFLFISFASLRIYTYILFSCFIAKLSLYFLWILFIQLLWYLCGARRAFGRVPSSIIWRKKKTKCDRRRSKEEEKKIHHIHATQMEMKVIEIWAIWLTAIRTDRRMDGYMMCASVS